MVNFLSFQNPESLAIGVALLLFLFTFTILKRFAGFNKGILIIIGFSISVITAWQLYREEFYGWEGTLGVVLYIVIIGFILKIFWAFFRGTKRSFGR